MVKKNLKYPRKIGTHVNTGGAGGGRKRKNKNKKATHMEMRKQYLLLCLRAIFATLDSVQMQHKSD